QSEPAIVADELEATVDLPVAADRVVTVEFVATDDDGEEVDASGEGGAALTYLHGHDELVPGLEAALVGKRAGDTFEVVVEPEDGYGEVLMEAPLELPRAMFEGEIEVGDELVFETESGEEAPIWVLAIDGDVVSVDLDHPLAGVRLHYRGRVLAVRDAAEIELEQGYPLDEDDEDSEAEPA
ncbi:MAG TPA: FKBP-type peptidyl-prolyl cis-trans isomerase, partial [Myxococcota bacterium]|nr:FKBP-type peptidyl-prolyl cis-trans isomerase [Myxococcota bacterium]